MQSVSRDTEAVEWTSDQPFDGPGAVLEGRNIVQLKVLSDRPTVPMKGADL